MDVQAILKELRAEREQLDEAIIALQRMQAGAGKRRGRPPAWMKAAAEQTQAASTPKRGRRPKAKATKAD
jgi:hypothetical protein